MHLLPVELDKQSTVVVGAVKSLTDVEIEAKNQITKS